MTDFEHTRARFHLPEGVVYLDGNSLGPLPLAARERVGQMMRDEWGELLIRGWNEAGWMAAPTRLGDRIAPLIGAAPGTVVVGETLSIRVFQALHAATALARPGRRVILSDRGNFPSDLYMADGLVRALAGDFELRLVEPEAIPDALDEDVAVVLLTEVDYRTGRLHDMSALTRVAHERGALTVWDLAHSAGALPVALAASGADFAAGCTYKYLNGGPGAPAFVYVAPAHLSRYRPLLCGWLGHAAPFAFDLDYQPGMGIERMRVGTPPIIAMAALDAALDVWEGVEMGDVRAASLSMAERFIAVVEAGCPEVQLASPRDPALRGSQVSFRYAHGYAVVQALIADGIVGDFRAPDVMRFGFTPLYLGEVEVDRAAHRLVEIINGKLWDRPRFHARAAVT